MNETNIWYTDYGWTMHGPVPPTHSWSWICYSKTTFKSTIWIEPGQQVNLETPQIEWWREKIKPNLSAARALQYHLAETVRTPQSIRPRAVIYGGGSIWTVVLSDDGYEGTKLNCSGVPGSLARTTSSSMKRWGPWLCRLCVSRKRKWQ
jgi:hypothetical protein